MSGRGGIRGLLFPAVAGVSTLGFSAVAVAGGLLGAPRGLYDWVHRTWGRLVLRAAGVRLEVRGLEHAQGRGLIFVSNHQSVLDIWALMAALPASLRFVAKGELGRIPVFARACRAAGHVFIDRRDPARAAEAIRRAGRRMDEEGLSLVLFPEGTRSGPEGLGRFKRGSFSLALETGAPLVPVAVAGGGRLLPPGSLRPRPGRLVVTCGEPIPLRGRGPSERDSVLEETRRRIASMLADADGDAAAHAHADADATAGAAPRPLSEPDGPRTLPPTGGAGPPGGTTGAGEDGSG